MNETVALRPRRSLGRTQEAIWAGQRLRPQDPIANMAHLYRIDGPIDRDRFVAAFDAVVRAADALRTVVADVGGVPHPRVLAAPPAGTVVVSLAVEAVDEWVSNRIAAPLDMSRCCYDSVLLDHGPQGVSWYLDLHHLVVDAWGATNVFRATAAAYAGEPLELPSFGAHLEAVAERATGEPARSAAAHWLAETAAGDLPLTDLYRSGPETSRTERLTVPMGTDRRRAWRRALDGELRSLSPDLGVLTVLVTVTAVYLHRLSGRTRIRVAVPVHHRRSVADRAAIGLYMELFPVTVEVRPDDTLRSVHAAVGRELFGLLRRAEPGTGPRVDVDAVVNVITASAGPFGPYPCAARWVHSGHADPTHRVRVQWFDLVGDGSPELALDLNEAVAGAEHRRFAAGHLGAVLDAVLERVDAPVGSVSLVGPTERAVLVERYNDRGPAPAGDRAVTRPLLDALRRHGDELALVENERRWTGSELAGVVERTAAWLRSGGIGPGDRVGVRLARGADALIAIHAINTAGAAFVPLDPAYPEHRLRHIVEDAGVVRVIDALPDPSQLPAVTGAPAEPSPDSEAYVLYTSGTTGLPKGVPIPHRGLAGYLEFARQAYLEDGRRPVVALFSSLSFDLTVTSLFLPFLHGGTVVVHPEDGPAVLAAVVRDGRADLLKATPSHLEVLARIDGAAALPVRTVVVGGEAFGTSLARRLQRLWPGAAIFNEYGPTEAVVGCMVHRFDAAGDTGPDVPIGVPAPGVRLVVLDGGGELVPGGAPGELHISRPGMAAGYHARPDLTAERFVERPQFGHGVYYRSGDLVRFTERGVLTYLGRIDEQLKVGGVRLEPAEVEAALLDHPRVDQAAVRLWSPAPSVGSGAVEVLRCMRCGLGGDVPGVVLDTEGICSACRDFDAVRDQAQRYFGTVEDLLAIRDRARLRRRGDHDVLHLLSGGKDSTYALYRLVELGFDVFAFTLDNGFLSEQAKDNIARVVADLGVDHLFATTDAMNEIFRDSLERYANVCNGCYKTIYTLAVNEADRRGIPVVVTGLSRGQFFETRLTPGQFALDRFDPVAIDAAVLEARKVYHRTTDAVSRLLDVSRFETDEIFERVEFVDFYRYVDVELTELLAHLDAHAPWIRPTDTGRSTNCLVNAAGIAVHKQERGFHNYAVPYSWDVRVGHKRRDEALDELDDPLDEAEVQRLLDVVGYRPRTREILTAWYRSTDVPAVDIDPDELRDHVAARVPAHAVPSAFVRVPGLPLSPNGKLDVAALPAPTRRHRDASGGYLAPSGPVEQTVCDLWAELLGIDRVGALDDFFELGGTSLDALQMVVVLSETYAVTVPEDRAFTRRTPRDLAAELEQLIVAAVEGMDDEAVERALEDGPS